MDAFAELNTHTAIARQVRIRIRMGIGIDLAGMGLLKIDGKTVCVKINIYEA